MLDIFFLNGESSDNYGSSYHDINAAGEECSHNSNRGGVFDGGSNNDYFYLCSIGTIEDTSSNYCAYNKSGNSYL